MKKIINTNAKILIVDLGGIGDVLLSIPALKALRNLYQQAEVSMLVSPNIYEIVKDFSFVDKVFKFYINYGGIIPFGKILANFRTLLVLRNKKFDLAINMRTLVSERSARKMRFLLDVIHAKSKIGMDTEGGGYFYNIKIPETKIAQKHEIEYNMDVLKVLGVKVVDKNINFKIDEGSQEKINDILYNNGVKTGDVLIGIHPGGMPSRRWPIENYAEVIQKLYDKIRPKFIITGGEHEKSLTKNLTKLIRAEAIDFSGRLSINELCALIKRCNLYISNDTGPMHIAAVLKTPLIAIFGPGDITRYDPRNIAEKAVVLYKKTECAPCNKINCKDMKCLNAISAEEVYSAALKMLRI